MNWRGEDPYYPAGATHDPSAPYNEPSYKDLDFTCEGCYTISRADYAINTDQYIFEGTDAVLDSDDIDSDMNPVTAMQEAIELLTEYKQHCDKAKIRKIEDVIYRLQDWQVDDFEASSDKIDCADYSEEDRGSDWRDE